MQKRITTAAALLKVRQPPGVGFLPGFKQLSYPLTSMSPLSITPNDSSERFASGLKPKYYLLRTCEFKPDRSIAH